MKKLFLIVATLVLIAVPGMVQIVTAQGTSTATPTPVLVGTVFATITATQDPAAGGASANTNSAAVPTRTPTLLPTGTPLDTATPQPLAQAQPTVISTGPLLAQEIPLSVYRIQNFELITPMQMRQFTFSIPNNWFPGGTNFLNLVVETGTLNRMSGALNGTQPALPSLLLQVSIDNTLAASVTLDAVLNEQNTVYSKVIRVPIAAKTLNPLRRIHRVVVSINGRDQCLMDLESRVTVRADQSYFHFEYSEGTPPLDLAVFPQPFFTAPLGNQSDNVVFVLPSKFTPRDVEAALSLATGMGQLSDNRIQFRVTTASELTAADKKDYNLIMIGKLGDNAAIEQLMADNKIPARLDANGKYSVGRTEIRDTDGVAQIVLNPDNPNRAILVLTGRTDDAMLKAARAMAGAPAQIGLSGPVALIADVVETPSVTQQRDSTFADLGYNDVLLTDTGSGVEVTRASYQFTIPVGTTITDDAYVFLDYDVADALLQTTSNINVRLNDQDIEGITVSKIANLANTPPSERRIKIKLPASRILSGSTNILSITLDSQFIRQNEERCDLPQPTASWFLVRSTSLLSLPLRQLETHEIIQPMLSQLPAPFTVTSNMMDVWYVLPNEPSTGELSAVLRIAGLFGNLSNRGGRFSPRVSFGEVPADVDRANYNFVVLGLMTNNAFLKGLNDQLPQPFNPDNNQLVQTSMDGVVYRLPEGFTLGVIEILRSPWAATRAVLVVTGTGPEGQGFAAGAMVGPQDLTDLEGNVVFVNPPNISAITIRPSNGSGMALVTPTEVNVTPNTVSTEAATATLEVSPTSTPVPTIFVATVTPEPSASPTPTEVNW